MPSFPPKRMPSSTIYLPLGQVKLRSRQLWAGAQETPGLTQAVPRQPSTVSAFTPRFGCGAQAEGFFRDGNKLGQPKASKLSVWDSQGTIYIYFLKGTFLKNLCIFAKWTGWGILATPIEPGSLTLRT